MMHNAAGWRILISGFAFTGALDVCWPQRRTRPMCYRIGQHRAFLLFHYIGVQFVETCKFPLLQRLYYGFAAAIELVPDPWARVADLQLQ
ncbi:hypothetical protein ASC93_21775 [Massilia sp. Root335]|nr:hypothetical protein ASC93_21775 [Massilia sp. Root335]